jgi:NAD-dependent dihydropyrimidine dehydrogenase PreA subunit
MDEHIYKPLAERLDALPSGFPPTREGTELRLLAHLFSPEEASLAAKLTAILETPAEIAERVGIDKQMTKKLLIGMADKGLITSENIKGEKGYCLMPFMIGFYEDQVNTMDEELAYLAENYMQQAYEGILGVGPQMHRVVPVNQTIQSNMEVHPYESIVDILGRAKAWCVFDCICRKQKQLIGESYGHPVEICMSFSDTPGAFDDDPHYKALTLEGAIDTLERAANAGLVHTVSNNQEGIGYLCNCCTCSCNVLRGISEMGISNILARSAFVNQVEEDLCNGCETCLSYCQFDALRIENQIAVVNEVSCVGCGVCVPTCDTEALVLRRRPEEEVLPIPATAADWGVERAKARGIDMDGIQ